MSKSRLEMTKSILKMRNVVAIAICLVGMTMFSGCDKDKDPNGNNNAEGTPKSVMNFIATAGDGQVSLSWNAPSDNGGSEITGYEVTMDNWANKENKTASQLSHIYNGLTNGTQYTFKVRAINAKGAGAESTATTTPTAGGGSAVYDLSLLPENVSVTLGYTTVPMTFYYYFIKIGKDYYKHEPDRSNDTYEIYLKHNNGTWTEYRRTPSGTWTQKETFNSTTIVNRLFSLHTSEKCFFYELFTPESSARENYNEATGSGSETIASVMCSKRDYEDDFQKITYWYSDTYKLFFKMDFKFKNQPALSYVMSVTKWDTSVTGFGGIDLP
jgi:hypothetical protein